MISNTVLLINPKSFKDEIIINKIASCQVFIEKLNRLNYFLIILFFN
jgi:hypothetical protein